MALSQADFYAYSRATGAPIPRDPEEQAQMAPEVLAFRRNQLKSPSQEQNQGFNLAQALGVGAALAGLGAGAYGATRFLRGTTPAQAAASAVKPATVDLSGAAVRRAAAEPIPQAPVPTKSAGLPVVRPSTPPPAPRIQSRQPAEGFSPRAYIESTGSLAEIPQGQSTELPRRANQPESFADLTEIQNNLLAQTRDQLANAVESGEDQVTGRIKTQLQRNEDYDMSQIETLEDDVAEKQHLMMQEAQPSQMSGYEPGTAINQVASQLPDGLPTDQTNPQKSAAQEFLNKQITGAQKIDLNKTHTYQDLVDAGLPEFEINARMQAYANTGEKALLNPDINSKTIGHSEFLKVLGVRNARVNHQMRLIEGELVNPEGDVRMSVFAKHQPSVSEAVSNVDSDTYEPISQKMTGLVGGVSTAPVSFKEDVQLSEQFDKAIQDFRNEWDRHIQENTSRLSTNQSDYSDIVMPARAERQVDINDLALPVRIEKDSEGRVLNRTLYRDILPAEVVSQIEQGKKTILDVPFVVNKARAYLDYKTNPTLVNKVVAKDYQRTGRALVDKYEQIVGPYQNSKYIPVLTEGRYFEPGETGITPKVGSGSRRGKLVGGVVEETLSDTLVPLKFQFEAQNGKIQTKTVGFNASGSTFPVQTLNELNELGPLLDEQGNVLTVSAAQRQRSVLTQPMAVQRVTPVLETDTQGNQRQRIVQRTARATGRQFNAPLVQVEDVIVDAPLQVLNAKTGEEISGAAQISRAHLNDTLDYLQGQLVNSGVNADYKQLAAKLDQHLIKTQNIKLPVLSSNTAFNFIENLRGRPGSRPTRTMYATTGNLGEIYPIAADQIEDFLSTNELPSLGARKAGQSGFASTTRPRQATGAPTFNITEAPKGTPTGRAAEDEEMLQQLRDSTESLLGESGLGYTGFRSVELGSSRRPGLLQQKIAPATTGVGSEMQTIRSELAKIKPQESMSQKTSASSAGLVDAVGQLSQQLLAQSKRRAGKFRNR